MPYLNKVMIIGNVGFSPEVKISTNGHPSCSLSIATNTYRKDKDSTSKFEETEWHTVLFLGKLAESVGKYLKKGDLVYVEGSLQTKEYIDKENIKRKNTSIKAYSMQILTDRKLISQDDNLNQKIDKDVTIDDKCPF